ncbi:hypothetical protein GRJ2_003340700 [Grus japonensis]|uniref:Uncharacterized protein n=1 Tax=Grus japonensis TaxID=30415 RepID=A0ABC9YF96_GRUJA
MIDLLSLVAELREEVERLRSIREAEREIDWWSQALPSLRQKQGQLTDQSQSEGDPVSSPRQAEGSSLKEGSEWKQVHAWRGRRTFSSSPTSPSHVPLCNRYEALAVEGHSSEDMDDSQATPEVAPRPKGPMPRVVTTPTKKKRRVIVVGDSLLKGTEGPICRADPPLREVCCLPGARVKDIARKLPSLVQPSDYYPLLLLHVGGDEAETRSTKAIKRDFRLLGQSLKDSGAQEEEDLCPGTSRAHRQSFKLGSKGEGDNIGLASDMLWDDVLRLEGQGTGEGPQPTAQRRAGCTTARSNPGGDEPGAPDATGTNRVTLGRYIKRIPATPANKSASSGAQLKCLYANARSMGNKEEELETCVCLQGYDLIGITEMWWDSSYDWSVGMEGYRLFRKDRQGR